MPFADNVSVEKRPEYYYYTIGPVAIISLNTDQNYTEGSTEYK